MECLICYTETEAAIKCDSCKTIMCEQCSEKFLMINETESMVPQCPSKCHTILDTTKLSPDLKKIYNNAIYKYIIFTNNKIISKDDMYVEMAHKIRTKRQEFLRQDMPLAIKLTAEIIGKKYIKNVPLLSIEIESEKKCLRTLCKGYLDSKCVCNLCSTEFCKNCEKILTTGHVCKKEDIESVNYIENMVHCPNVACKLPIERSEGCNHMTCATCKTSFDYTTGSLSEHGSHNKSVELVATRKMSSEFEKIYSVDIIQIITDIEDRMVNPSMKTIIKLALQIRTLMREGRKEEEEEEEEENLKDKLAKKIEIYIQEREIYRQGLKLMDKIMELHNNKILTFDNLQSLQ